MSRIGKSRETDSRLAIAWAWHFGGEMGVTAKGYGFLVVFFWHVVYVGGLTLPSNIEPANGLMSEVAFLLLGKGASS